MAGKVAVTKKKPRPAWERPEITCAREGHKLGILANSPYKTITICVRRCGYYKVTNRRA